MKKWVVFNLPDKTRIILPLDRIIVIQQDDAGLCTVLTLDGAVVPVTDRFETVLFTLEQASKYDH